MKSFSKVMFAFLATGFLSCGLFCQHAYAFSGDILFAGSAHASGNSGLGNTKITFTNSWSVASLPAPDGAYAATAGTHATFTNFIFHGTGTGAVLNAAVVPEWTFSYGGRTYSFDLLTLIDGTTTRGTVDLSGTGIAYINGGNATAATWSLQGTGNKFTFNFTSSSTSAIPDGGSAVALLGIALAGIEIVRRKIKAA